MKGGQIIKNNFDQHFENESSGKHIVLTFDDGCDSFYDYVYPVFIIMDSLQQYIRLPGMLEKVQHGVEIKKGALKFYRRVDL